MAVVNGTTTTSVPVFVGVVGAGFLESGPFALVAAVVFGLSGRFLLGSVILGGVIALG
jgi:hypothetical protein